MNSALTKIQKEQTIITNLNQHQNNILTTSNSIKMINKSLAWLNQLYTPPIAELRLTGVRRCLHSKCKTASQLNYLNTE